MKFRIDEKIFATFDAPQIGVVVARGLDNHGESAEVTALLRGIEQSVRESFKAVDPLTSHPNIASWRKAYKQFGTDPHEYRCSIEALVRRVVKGNAIPHINKLVDIYNYISLKYLVPVGGEDLNMVKGDLHLMFATGDEQFIRLGGTENEPPTPGEVIYRDDVAVMCRRWNWRESDRTKLTEETKDAVLEIETLAPVGRATLDAAVAELAQLVKKHCGGEAKTLIADKANSVVELT